MIQKNEQLRGEALEARIATSIGGVDLSAEYLRCFEMVRLSPAEQAARTEWRRRDDIARAASRAAAGRKLADLTQNILGLTPRAALDALEARLGVSAVRRLGGPGEGALQGDVYWIEVVEGAALPCGAEVGGYLSLPRWEPHSLKFWVRVRGQEACIEIVEKG